MGGPNLPPDPGWDKVNVYENLSMEAALPALPLNTPLIDITLKR